MKCKILHLPTATYLYHDITMTSSEHDHAYCYSEYEIETQKFPIDREKLSPIFPSRKEAREYVTVWTGSRNSGLHFQKENMPTLVEHFSIISEV